MRIYLCGIRYDSIKNNILPKRMPTNVENDTEADLLLGERKGRVLIELFQAQVSRAAKKILSRSTGTSLLTLADMGTEQHRR